MSSLAWARRSPRNPGVFLVPGPVTVRAPPLTGSAGGGSGFFSFCLCYVWRASSPLQAMATPNHRYHCTAPPPSKAVRCSSASAAHGTLHFGAAPAPVCPPPVCTAVLALASFASRTLPRLRLSSVVRPRTRPRPTAPPRALLGHPWPLCRPASPPRTILPRDRLLVCRLPVCSSLPDAARLNACSVHDLHCTDTLSPSLPAIHRPTLLVATGQDVQWCHYNLITWPFHCTYW